MRRLSLTALSVVILTAAACAPLPLREVGGGFRPSTRPTSLAPNSPLAQAARDPAQCYALLQSEGVSFTPLADQQEGDACSVHMALRLGATPVAYAPARPMMTCPLAAEVVMWARQSVQPAARELLGAEVREIDHFGVYACRRVNGQATGQMSAHARAEAIDVGGFRLSNGRRVTVLADWRQGAEAQFLHRIRDEACRVFGTVLSPDYNALHANHLHLEAGARGVCG